MKQEFEQYWHDHRSALEKHAPRQLLEERDNFNKMNTAGDWLLFIVPILIFVGFIEVAPFASFIINTILGLLLAAVAYVLTIMVKPYVTGKRDINSIEADIKEHFHQIYTKEGTQGLQKILGSRQDTVG